MTLFSGGDLDAGKVQPLMALLEKAAPLHVAATACQCEHVELRLSSQFKLISADQWGCTPFGNASAKGCTAHFFILKRPGRVGDSTPYFQDCFSNGYHSAFARHGRHIGGAWSRSPQCCINDFAGASTSQTAARHEGTCGFVMGVINSVWQLSTER
jgi:hypothetical protein